MPTLRSRTYVGLLFQALPFLAAFAPGPAAVEVGGRDFADPFVLLDGTTYYGFATGSDGEHLQVAKSSDLHGWSMLGDALPRLPNWASRASGFTWAPSVLKRDRYVLYYSTREAASGIQCISRATSLVPGGPYDDDSSAPIVCQSSGESSMCGSIDPSPFVDADGTAYLIWKSDENGAPCRAAPHLWSQRLRGDGLDVVGSPVALMVADRAWEGQLIEGPSMIRHDGAYYLFYSANWYDSARYAVGYATCAGPSGPCLKRTTEAPLLHSAGAALGPGGEELFADASGATWIAYHAWSAPNASYAEGGSRSLRLAPVLFESGRPVIGAPSP